MTEKAFRWQHNLVSILHFVFMFGNKPAAKAVTRVAAQQQHAGRAMPHWQIIAEAARRSSAKLM
jgi:hypothetical protein